MQVLTSFLCGLVFGCGLVISGMTQPSKVLGFLDILGHWDPTLAFVMAGALAMSGAGYALARRFRRPMFAAQYLWPTRSDIDRSLVAGAMLFGIGWGLVGLCPGPALENLAGLSPRVILFVLAMIAGMGVQAWWQARLLAESGSVEAAPTGSDG